jgi:hypothetical protein
MARRPRARDPRPADLRRERVTAFEVPDTALVVRMRLLENADDLDALFVLAALRAQDGLVAEGISILDRVLLLNPTYPGGWRFKAILHRMRGEDAAEQSAWAKAEDIDR